MSALHLNHLIPWKDLFDRCFVYVDPGIEMPVGKTCGRIHLVNKETRLKVENRKYLADKICTADDCETAAEKSVFRKSEKKTFSIPMRVIPWRAEKGSPFYHFFDSLSNAIEEFAKTERRKFLGQRNASGPSVDTHQMVEKLKENGKWPEEIGCLWGCDCPLLSLLIEMGDLEALLSFSDDQLRKAIDCSHGGQAVGNNFRFLSDHVLAVYLITNLIAALDLHEKPDLWGQMKPGSYFRQCLMEDCDGQTFLFGSRRYLKDDVYMKDWEAMKELSKNCFRHLYMVDMVRKEVGYTRKPKDYLLTYSYCDDEYE